MSAAPSAPGLRQSLVGPAQAVRQGGAEAAIDLHRQLVVAREQRLELLPWNHHQLDASARDHLGGSEVIVDQAHLAEKLAPPERSEVELRPGLRVAPSHRRGSLLEEVQRLPERVLLDDHRSVGLALEVADARKLQRFREPERPEQRHPLQQFGSRSDREVEADLVHRFESRGSGPQGSISPVECARRGQALTSSGMRRARFYIFVLGLTLLPQIVAASDLVRWLTAQGQLALGLSVPGLLLALNLPMLAEILRRKKRAQLPRFFAAFLQTPWTAWWLGSLFYAMLRAVWTVAHLGPAELPVPLALAPFALALYGTLFGARLLRRERVTVPVAGLPEGWRGARIVQLSDLHPGRHLTRERLQAIARRAARLDADLLVVTGDIVHNSPAFARQAAAAIAAIPARHGGFA